MGMDHCKSTLSGPRQRLLIMMQQLPLRKIENLIVNDRRSHFRARAQDHSGDKTWAGFGPA